MLGFATNPLSEGEINGFIVLSPSIRFGGLGTGMTAGDVFKRYPKAHARIDLLTDWEHVYVEALGIELVFKTDESSRMGIYNDEVFVKLRDTKTRIDFIVVE